MKKEINIQIGARVRIARERLHLSREQLAETLDISVLFLSYIECGQKGMSLTTLQKLCESLQVSADFILLGRDPASPGKTEAQILLESLEPEYQGLALESLQQLIRMIGVVQEKAKR